MSVQQEKFREIADAIRDKTGETDLIKPSDFAGKVSEVYDAGKQAENKAFWESYMADTYKNNGRWRFAGPAWSLDTFKPTKDIIFNGYAPNLFYMAENLPLDLRPTQFKKQFGVNFSLGRISNIEQWLSSSAIYAVGTIDVTTASNRLYYCFQSAKKLQLIEKIILPSTAEPSMNTSNAFMNCSALTIIEAIEGVIGNSLSFAWSTLLTHDTLMNIINALADYSDGSYQKTLTLGTTNLAKLTDEEKAIATEKGWTLA